MKCHNCLYYKSSCFENECLAFGWYNFRINEECDSVDINFNLIKDDEGRDYFESREDVFKRLNIK